MKIKTKIFAILLVSVSFCDLSIVDASIFDKIMQKVEKAKDTIASAKDKALSAKDKVMAMKDKAMSAKDKLSEMKDKAVSAKDKVMEMKDKAVSAKDKIMEMKDKAVSEKDKLVQDAKDSFAGLSAQKKDAESKDAEPKAEEISGEAEESKGKISEIAEKLNISEDKVNEIVSMVDKVKDKTSDSTDTVNEVSDKLVEQSEQNASTAQKQEETVKLVSSENSETSESKNVAEPVQDEAVFSEEVIAKMDKLIPAKEVIDQLKIISFDGQAITDVDIPYLVERLKKLASEGIKKVSLSFRRSSLSLNGAMKILEGLKAHPQFVSGLTFSGNALGDEGAVSIASNLSNFPMLKYLFFSDMGISGDGAVAILSMINQMAKNDDGTSIQLIDLSNNQINDEHLDTLVKCWNEIKDNEQMTLMLQGNPFKNTVQIDIPNNIKLVLK